MKHLHIKFAFLIVFLSLVGKAQQKTSLYKNPKVATHLRVADLLKRMTVNEKINQLLSHLDANAKNLNENLLANATGLNLLKDGYGIIQPFDVSSGANFKLLKDIVKNDASILPFIDQAVARVLH
ncbi:hypothetical protein [Pedobacter psychroterrae]|uniref:Beta-glucosidase n=1 Tax=Pedobacter psychroterrae TaxID=2530453 RepID=A0A4V2MLC5_9SPHI|nr:hypothetical protein [Pedobacter psychroterrae]TCD01547.1 hypothetical protein EZ437_12505 [Pedobacter psychroterrae]